MSKPCEYCGHDLPFGVDKKTRQTRSRHFDSCEVRLSEKLQESEKEIKDEPPQFPTMLRKMWSGREVQDWINEHWVTPPQQEAKDEPEGLRDAVFTVIEGFTLPNDVRKILETAYYNTTPPQRTWVGLTAEEREQVQTESYGKVPHHVALIAAVETRLKEKNT